MANLAGTEVASPHRFLRLTAILALGLMTGCGTSEYERRLEAYGLAAAKSGASREAFNLLYAEDFVTPNEPVRIRVPQVCESPYNAGKADDKYGNAAILPTELQPPNVELPGFKIMWRGYKDNAQRYPTAFHVYLGQRKAAGASMADEVRAQLAKAFSGQALNWEDVPCLAEDGQTQLPWKKIHVAADMTFGTPGGTDMTLPGILDVWVHESNGWQVLVGFRIPEELDQEVKLTSLLAPAVCGSVKTPAAQ